MPATKDDITLFTAKSILGGAGPTFSGFVDLRASYGGIFQGSVKNGSNRQGQGVVVQAEVGPTQDAAKMVLFDCRKVIPQDANEETPFTIRIPVEPKFCRLKVTHGDEDATVESLIFTRLTQV